MTFQDKPQSDKETLEYNEELRKKRSLFAHKDPTSEHSLKLQEAAKPLNKVTQIQGVCVFSANPRAGQQVAVVLDVFSEFTSRIRERIAERCPEPFLTIIQPFKNPDKGIYAVLHMLCPGGPVIRSMCLTMSMAAVAILCDYTLSPNPFPALPKDGSTIILRAEAEGWKEESRVRIEADGSVWAAMPPPKLQGLVPPSEVCEVLNINTLALQTEFPTQLVQAVARHLIVPVRSRRLLADVDPYFDLVSELCRRHGCEGLHLFSVDPMAGGHAHTRSFSPLYYVEEEAASASANAALAAYLHYHRVLPIDEGGTVVLEQGYALAPKPRPSKVHVRLHFAPDRDGLDPDGSEGAAEHAGDSSGGAERAGGGDTLQPAAGAAGPSSRRRQTGWAVGESVTRERLQSRGGRYTSAIEDERRFNLPAGYYEAVAEREAEIRRRREAARRAGKAYKEEKGPYRSEARLPPPAALPAPIAACWVGGVCVPSARPPFSVSV